MHAHARKMATSDPDLAALVATLGYAQQMIVSTIERECEALRSGHMLAAWAFGERLRDAARLYAGAAKAARSALEGAGAQAIAALEERREVFSALLKVEFAVLAAEREAAKLHRDLALGAARA